MFIPKVVYTTLFTLVTFFYNLYITLCEVADRLKPVWTQAVLAVEIGTGYTDTLLLKSTGREFTKQDKLLPRHLACVFVGESVKNVNIDKIVTIVRWCSAAGIRSISLFDHTGAIRENRDAIQHKLRSAEPVREDGFSEETYFVHEGFIKRDTYLEGANGINIYLMSRSDGRPMFAQVAQVVAAENDYQKIDQKIVEDAMQRYYPHEPELLLQFGMSYSNITWGYPPWLLRWTQMLTVPCYSKVRADHIASALKTYGGCQQRFGK